MKDIYFFFCTSSCRDQVNKILQKESLNILFREGREISGDEWKNLGYYLIIEFQPEFIDSYHSLVKNSNISVIFLTDPENEQSVQELIKVGAYDYLYKDRLSKLPLILDRLKNKQEPVFSLENQTKYRAIFENSIDGILLTVPDGRILAANPSACKIFQRTEEELCRVGRAGIVDHDDSSCSDALSERDRTGKVKAEIMMVRKDGSRFPAEVTSSVFLTAKGEEQTSMIIRDISENKKAQDLLRSSEESYEFLFKFNPLPNIIYDIDNFEIVEVNQAAVDYYNYSYQEFTGSKVLDFLPDEEIIKLKAFLSDKRNSGKLVQQQMIHLKKGASPVPVETFGYKLNYKNRNCRLVICLDVSEREMYLDQIRQKSQQLEAAQEIAKIGYWIHNLDNDEFFWSKEVYSIWERKKDTFHANAQNFRKTIHPDDLQKFEEANTKALSGEQVLDLEHRILTPDGKIKWVYERGKLTDDGSKKGIFEGTVQDITEQKETLEKLIQVESRQRGILQSQTNYLIRTDLQGHYSYCNEKFRQDFSWIFPDGNLIGKYAKHTIHDHHHERVLEFFEKCIANPNTVYQLEIDKLQKDGGVKTTLWDFNCLTNSVGQPHELQCVGIDITDRVKTEKSLKESITRNELILKATSDAVYDWNCTTGEIFWSEGYQKIFGYDTSRKGPNIEEWARNVHPDDSEVVDNVFSLISGKEEIFQAEYRYKKACGEYAHVMERGSIVRDKDGTAMRMVGALQDITEIKSALLQVMTSESRYKGLVQSQTNYMIRIDLQGRYTYANKKFKNDFGWIYSGKGITGENSIISIMPYHYDRIHEVSMKCLSNPDEVFQVEIDKPAKGGGVKTTLWDMIFLKNSDNEGGEIQCVGIDITDRVKAEAEKNFQANLLNKIGQAVVATDVPGKIVYWNNAATEIYGWSPEEALGKKLEAIFPMLLKEKLFEVYKGKAIKETRSCELRVKNRWGEEIDVFLTNSPVYNEGKLTGYIGVSTDITERIKADNELKLLNKDLKKYTEELVAANKGLEQFSYIISHNLRAPVANIIGLGELMEEEYPAEVKIQFQQELLSNVKRLDTIIRDLNNILQVKVNTSEQKEPIDLQELVDTIKEGIRQVIQKEKVEILTDFSKVPYVNSIRTYLHSVFFNLIFNSIKYRSPEASPIIKITAAKRSGKIILSFTDNGMGIDLSKKGDQIFGLYKRFHNHVEGKGMGLFMVKTQVELMGGKININSEVNVGTQFTIEFLAENNLEKEENDEIEEIYYS